MSSSHKRNTTEKTLTCILDSDAIDSSEETSEVEIDLTCISDHSELYSILNDFSISENVRIKAVNKYNELFPDNMADFMSKIAGMYLFSGMRSLQTYLDAIVRHATIPTFYRLDAANSLLSFTEYTDSDDKDVIAAVDKRDNKRRDFAFSAINYICDYIYDLPTPCRVNAICTLMQHENYHDHATTLFLQITNDVKLDVDYRYKIILDLENKPKINYIPFAKAACLSFFNQISNATRYRILAGQYLLRKCELEEDMMTHVQIILLGFANDTLLDYNIRADAADVILSLGSDENKLIARNIIMDLGREGKSSNPRTIFENAQNVHTSSFEKSVLEILEFLNSVPIISIDDNMITFYDVKQAIDDILASLIGMPSDLSIKCSLCNCVRGLSQNIDEKPSFCSDKCKKIFERMTRVDIALNRIFLDRAVYSKFNCSLSSILVRLWSFILSHEHTDELKLRLIEELDDMAGTCSTGYASRLVNVLSGFTDFNMRMSWEDQITANLAARLNALALTIVDKTSVFYTCPKTLQSVVELWLNINTRIKQGVIDVIKKSESVTDLPPMSQIREYYLRNDFENKIETCISDFSDAVLSEMTISPSKFADRQNFLLFFRTHISEIRTQMHLEFKDHIPDVDFDLYFHKAIFVYEGCH